MTAPSWDAPRAARLARVAAANAARSEDLAFMAEAGETQEGAARRLGLNTRGLERWCNRHDPAVWAALGRNSGPVGHVREGRVVLGRVS